jgi:hypothetical protein
MKGAIVALGMALASMGSGQVDYDGERRRWRYEPKKEKPKEPKYSLPKVKPKGTQLFEGEIEGIKVSFYYGTEKSKQKKLIKITNEIKSYLKIR